MGKMGYGPHSFRAGFERRGGDAPMEGPSGGRLRLTCEKYGPHKKYTKLVYLEQEIFLLTNCAKPFEEKTFVEALGAKGQANPSWAK